MAPNMNRPVNVAATQSRVINPNATTSKSFSVMNQTSHTVLPHQRAKMNMPGASKSLSKHQMSGANNIYAKGSSSIRTLIRLANTRDNDEDDEVRTMDDA